MGCDVISDLSDVIINYLSDFITNDLSNVITSKLSDVIISYLSDNVRILSGKMMNDIILVSFDVILLNNIVSANGAPTHWR